jgi:hypothetical protein
MARRFLPVMAAAMAAWGAWAGAQMTIEPPPETVWSKFRSSEDGWLDVRGYLDEK